MHRHTDANKDGRAQEAALSRQALHDWCRRYSGVPMSAMGYHGYMTPSGRPMTHQPPPVPYVHAMPAYHTAASSAASKSNLPLPQHAALHSPQTSSETPSRTAYSAWMNHTPQRKQPTTTFRNHARTPKYHATPDAVPPPLDLSGSTNSSSKRVWSGAEERPLDLSMKKPRVDDDVVIVDHIKPAQDKNRHQAHATWPTMASRYEQQQSSSRGSTQSVIRDRQKPTRDASHWNSLATAAPNRVNNNKALLMASKETRDLQKQYMDHKAFQRPWTERDTRAMQSVHRSELTPRNPVYSMVGEGLKPLEGRMPSKPSTHNASHTQSRPLDPKDYYKTKSIYSDLSRWPPNAYNPPTGPSLYPPPKALANDSPEVPNQPLVQPQRTSSSSPSLAIFGKKKYLLDQLSREQSPATCQEPEPNCPQPWNNDIVESGSQKKPGSQDIKPSGALLKDGDPDVKGASPYRTDSHHFTERGNKIIPVANVQPMRKLSDKGSNDETTQQTTTVAKDSSDFSKLYIPTDIPFQHVRTECATVAHAVDPFLNSDVSSPPDVFKTTEEPIKDLSLHFVTPKGRHKLLFQKADEESGEETKKDGEEEDKKEEEAKKKKKEDDPPVAPERKKRKYVRRKKLEEKPKEVKPKRKYVRRKPLESRKKPESKVKQIQDVNQNDKAGVSKAAEEPSKGKQETDASKRKTRRVRERNANQTKIRAALRSARRSLSYNKNAAYEDELRRDEQRKLLKRTKKNGVSEESQQNPKSGNVTDVVTASGSFLADQPEEEEEEEEDARKESDTKQRKTIKIKKKVVRNKIHGLKLSDLAVIGRKRRYNFQRKRGFQRKPKTSETAAETPDGVNEENLFEGGTAADLPDAKRLFVCKETGESMLHKAARLGYEDVAENCLTVKGIDPNIRDNAGYTPLHECSVAGNLRIGIKLLNYGADVNGKALDGTRPIHDAVDNDRLEMTRLLLSHGADPFIANYSGRTPGKLARSPSMKALIQGYFADINVHSDETHPWQLQHEFDQRGLSGCDVMGQPPEDDDTPLDKIEFDFFDEEPMPTFYLSFGRAKGPRNYHLLKDVAQAMKLTRENVIAQNTELTYVQVPLQDWDKYVEQRTAGFFGAVDIDTGHIIEDAEELKKSDDDAPPKVLLVEVSTELKKVLDITTENLNNCTALRYSCNSKDLVRLKSKFKATRIDGSDKKGETGSLEELLKTPLVQRFNLNCDQIKKPCSVTLFDIKHTMKMNGQADKRECNFKKRSAKTAAYKRGLKSDKMAENILVNAIKSLKSLCLIEFNEDESPPLVKKKGLPRGRKPKSLEHVHKNHLNGFVMKGLVQTLVTKTFKKKKKGAILSESSFVKRSALFDILADKVKLQQGETADSVLPVLEKESKSDENQSSTERKQCPTVTSKNREMPELTPCAAT